MLRLHNTLSNTEEEFHPLEEGVVRFYTCGPTVYDYAHVGNFRTFVFQDLLRKYLKYRKYRVIHVMNITDVDDKTIQNARDQGMSLKDYTAKYTQAFLEDIKPSGLIRRTSCRAQPSTFPKWSPDPQVGRKGIHL